MKDFIYIILIIFSFLLGLNGSKQKMIESYNLGYMNGRIFAYQNVSVCGAKASEELVRLSKLTGLSTKTSYRICEE